MIFVTVGTQLPFDRLITAIDIWAAGHPAIPIFAQTGPSNQVPANMKSAQFVPPELADEMFQKAELIISHAGMGSILTALRYKKPILIMPRRASLGEHRNEHQLATAKWLGKKSGVTVAWNESEIAPLLERRAQFNSGEDISESATPELIDKIQKFIFS